MKSTATSHVIRNLWGSAAITIVLTTMLSWWLVSSSWGAWNSARNSVVQFDHFYRVLQVSNDLADERAYANELVLSSEEKKPVAWTALQRSRDVTDRHLAQVPENLLSSALLAATRDQLTRSRQRVDGYRQQPLSDPGVAQQAIDGMLAATDFYHEALFRQTSSFLQLEPSALGPILRAQALGELRDASGRLGAQMLIPLATRTPIPLHNSEAISRGQERITVLWWLLRTQGEEVEYLPGFEQQLAQTRQQFEQQGLTLIDSLRKQSARGERYSLDATTFATQYHASVSAFDALLNTYLSGVRQHYLKDERRALLHLVLVLAILAALSTLAIGVILYIRARVLQPIVQLTRIADRMVAGKQDASVLDEGTVEEVQTLMTTLGTLGDRLHTQTMRSQQLERESNEDPLTGLYNRRAFDAQASVRLESATKGFPAWLVMIDVDHFKRINDSWGHPTGDAVLVALATALKNSSRPGDVIGRLGGEEFAVMLRAHGHKDVRGYTRRIQQAIRRLRFTGPNGEPFTITASFGVAMGWSCTLNEMIASADAALYDAKNSGRDRISGLPD